MTTPPDLGPTSGDWLPAVNSNIYQRAVARITAENRRLREQLESAQAEHLADVRKLRAELNEAITPEMVVLRRELSRWRTRALAAEARLKQHRRTA